MCNFRTDNLAKHLFVFIAECNIVQLGSTAFALIAASLVRACKSGFVRRPKSLLMGVLDSRECKPTSQWIKYLLPYDHRISSPPTSGVRELDQV